MYVNSSFIDIDLYDRTCDLKKMKLTNSKASDKIVAFLGV